MRGYAMALLAAVLAGCGSGGGGDSAATVSSANTGSASRVSTTIPRPGHVFVIVLENEDAGTTFGAGSPAPYLARELRAAGAFVPNYFGTAHRSLSNYLAMISGQAPTAAAQDDCPVYTNVVPATPAADGQVKGDGCVYPRSVQTVADQLEAASRTWKGYMEDMGKDAARDGGRTCAHPPPGAPDRAQRASPADQYATRHNPFVYFHSIIDEPSCAKHVVALGRLARDLASAATTPSLSFITPDLCNDGHDATCADGGPGGLAAADAFLRAWVPRITASAAYRKDGLLAIVFDEAGSDSSACCGEQPGPNTPKPGIGGPGGGRTGAVLLSPFIRAGTQTTTSYNHYGLLRSIEDAFGLAPLGYARTARPFGTDVFSAEAR